MYYKRIIDHYLSEWASRDTRKPILLRGARQVGKSSAVRHLGQQFKNYVEINFEMEPQYKAIFKPDLNVSRIVMQIAALSGRVFKNRIKIWYKKWCYIGVSKLLIFNTLTYKIALCKFA